MQKQIDEGTAKGTSGGPERKKDQDNPCNSPKNDCGSRGKGRRGGGGKGGRRK